MLRSGTGVLYHVTIESNVSGITNEGVRPDLAQRNHKASWWVSKQRLEWAMLHTSARHGTPIEKLFVCAALIYWEDMKRTNLMGIYYTYELIHPESIQPAIAVLDKDPIESEEFYE